MENEFRAVSVAQMVCLCTPVAISMEFRELTGVVEPSTMARKSLHVGLFDR